jgi:hypothetical protein
MTTIRRGMLLAGALYLAWVAATYLLEGRVELLRRPDPLGRAVYALVANVVIGTAVAAWLLRSSLDSGLVALDQLGFRRFRRALAAVAIGMLLGFGVFLLQGPRSREPIVLLNVFAQVLPTSIAEVMVCWAVIGATTESAARPAGRAASLFAACFVSAALFGVYHVAHSTPFNEPAVVAFLTLVGLATSLVYFLGRDLYATVAAHNYLAMVGIIGSADLAAFRQLLFPLYSLAFIAVVVLVGSDVLVLRRTRADRSSRLG